MDTTLLFSLMLMALVGMAWWANYSKRNKIYCTLNRVNKTQISKFVKITDRYVIFEGKRFDIIPSCIVFRWWEAGLAEKFFPQWVATLNFSHNNRMPIDPNTLEPAVISPEVRAKLDKEEWVKSYAKNFTPPKATKQTTIQQYLPFIMIGAVAIIGFLLYNYMQGISAQVATQGNILDAITK